MKELLILLLSIKGLIAINVTTEREPSTPSNNTGKDMYLINAMIYQIGIISNKTNPSTSNRSIHENREAFLFYPNNNITTNLNLTDIPNPLLTEMTVQRYVGVAPIPKNTSIDHPPLTLPLSALQNLTFDRLQNLKKFKDEIKPFEVREDLQKKSKQVNNKTVALWSLNPFALNHKAGKLHIMSSPKLGERCRSNMNNEKKLLINDCKEDSLDNSMRDTLKSDRGGKSEEDWRRRTIIIEKKDGSYGFSLQSYGIHYRKEQEIEVITYVDHVEPEGPAALAGMREGDVILSINGTDVERANHAAVVDAINSCDSRMRMVVIFEDCVRKVELHLKYINLQRALQSKMRELEQLCVRERQLYDSNWKTHSLPSQKKKSSPSDVISDSDENNVVNKSNYCRPTLSSENVTAAKPPHANVLMYQYLDSRYGACIIQPNIRTGSFVITVGSPRSRGECHHYVAKGPGNCHRASEMYKSDEKHTKVHRNSHSHSCAPCMAAHNNQDANSLEAYDLASPCCDPHCVPNAKKKVRRKKECSKEHKRKDKCQHIDKATQKSENCSHTQSRKKYSSAHCSSRYRYLTSESTQTSQCSLQSYATSNATIPCDNSASSYSTSLSSDTLFWDNDRSEAKASPKIQYQGSHHHVKPKSWDNLTTKAFGGYGFGYGYLDTGLKSSNRSKSHGRSHSSRSTQSHHEYQHPQEKHSHRQSAPQHHPVYGRSHSHCAPTKSTESLTVLPKYQLESSGSESRLTCDCAESIEYYRRLNSKSPGDTHSSNYYSQHIIYPTHSYKKKDSNISSEITRL